MAGITKQWPAGQAAVKAIEAGVDVLLMPANPEEAVNAVVAAVRRGSITRERIDRSVRKVLAAKVRLGLDRRRTVDLDRLMDQLDTPEDIAKAQEVADRAITLVRNERNLVPLTPTAKACFLVLTETRGSQQGRLFASEIRKRVANVPLVTLDPTSTAADIDQAFAATDACDTVVVSAFASVAAYRGNVALAGSYPALLDRLTAAAKPVLLISFGNPYLLRAFPKVSAYIATYSSVQPSESAAAKAIFGEIPIGGRLPVSIPGLAAVGDGIQLPAATAR